MSNKPNSRTKQTTSKRVADARGETGGSNGLLIGGAVAIVIVVALFVAVFVGRSGNTDVAADDVLAHAEPVSVSGEPLPTFPDSGTDPAIGMTMPTLTGDDLTGKTLTIGPDGHPQMLVYLAHWCPHCRAEVPVLVEWLKNNGNGDVEVRGITTGIDKNKPNYPPTAWLAGEQWPVPTLLDPSGTAAEASGLSSYPYFIFLDAQGKVTSRISGEQTTEAIGAELDKARAGSSGTPGTVEPGGASSPAG